MGWTTGELKCGCEGCNLTVCVAGMWEFLHLLQYLAIKKVSETNVYQTGFFYIHFIFMMGLRCGNVTSLMFIILLNNEEAVPTLQRSPCFICSLELQLVPIFHFLNIAAMVIRWATLA